MCSKAPMPIPTAFMHFLHEWRLDSCKKNYGNSDCVCRITVHNIKAEIIKRSMCSCRSFGEGLQGPCGGHLCCKRLASHQGKRGDNTKSHYLPFGYNSCLEISVLVAVWNCFCEAVTSVTVFCGNFSTFCQRFLSAVTLVTVSEDLCPSESWRHCPLRCSFAADQCR